MKLTNEQINALSDYEINCMVAKAIGLESVMFFTPVDRVDPECCTGPVWNVASNHLHHGFLSKKGHCFDPCNDPDVMMPIVFEAGISLCFCHKQRAWLVTDDSVRTKYYHYDENPLRASAIVYLKSKGVL